MAKKQASLRPRARRTRRDGARMKKQLADAFEAYVSSVYFIASYAGDDAAVRDAYVAFYEALDAAT